MKEDTLFTVFLYLGVGLVLGAGMWTFVQVARTDGRVDYCYSHATNVPGQGYEIVGHRPWRPDATIGYSPTPEAADKLIRESAVCSGKVSP